MYNRFYEYGLHCIPIKPQSKQPVNAATGFNKWALDGIPQNKIDEFEEHFGTERGYGIALLLGPASGLVCVDIDSDKEEILDLCPNSPIARRGKKGWARFFLYNPNLKNANYKSGDDGLDILIERKYIVLPPSIHPETKKPYEWETFEQLPESRDMLVELTNELLSDAVNYFNQGAGLSDGSNVDLTGTYYSPDGQRSPHGSYNRIKALAQAMIADGKDPQVAVEELLKYDEIHHVGVQFFSDKRHMSDFGADPWSNANRLYANLLHTTNMIRVRAGLEPQVPKRLQIIEVQDNADEVVENSENQLLPLPVPKAGLIKTIHDFIVQNSATPQSKFALAAAMEVLSGFLCGRIEFNGQWPVLWSMVLGRTGSGKDQSRKFASSIFNHEEFKKYNLFGVTSYTSAPQLILKLPEQRMRVDIIDEFSSFIKGMGQKDAHKRHVATELAHLYTIGGGWYGGIEAITRKEQTGACYNPCVNILAMCQPETLANYATKDMLDMGFITRFLYFYEDQGAEFNDSVIKKTYNLDSVVNEIKYAFPEPVKFAQHIENMEVTTTRRHKPQKMAIGYDNEKKLIEIARHYVRATQSADMELERAFLSRAYELSLRVAMVHAGSLDRREILDIDIDYGVELFENSLSNSKTLLATATAANEYEKQLEAVYEYVKKQKRTASDISNRFRSITKVRRYELIDHLVESGRVSEGQLSKGGKVYYV